MKKRNFAYSHVKNTIDQEIQASVKTRNPHRQRIFYVFFFILISLVFLVLLMNGLGMISVYSRDLAKQTGGRPS